jgi:hypothetical protein
MFLTFELVLPFAPPQMARALQLCYGQHVRAFYCLPQGRHNACKCLLHNSDEPLLPESQSGLSSPKKKAPEGAFCILKG